MAAEFTREEKLEVIESFVTQWRPARSSGDAGERDVYLILKAIADDIRAGAPDAPGRALSELQNAIEAANATKSTRDGYEMGKLRRIAELLIGLWPVVRRALEQFEAEVSRCKPKKATSK